MKVVIIGAGTIGLATAKLLTEEDHEVILVDKDDMTLDRAAQDLDLATRIGSGTDWKLLEEFNEIGPELFLSLADNDEVNLTACAIAKGLGFPQTVARVRDWNFLSPTRLDFGRIFAIDYFVSPELLAAGEINQYLLSLGSIRMENYAHGAVQMRTLVVPSKWAKAGKPLSDLQFPEGVMVGLIAREQAGRSRAQRIIFPHGSDHLEPGDEVTMLGMTQAMEQVHTFFGSAQKKAHSVFIIGGGRIGEYLAKTLSEGGTVVRLVDKERDRCAKLSERLPRATVIHHDGTDMTFLQAERVDQADVVIAATDQEEVNVLACLLARQAGSDTVIAIVGSKAMGPMLKEQGISHFVSPLSAAANRILAIAGAGAVTMASALYNNRATVIELKVSPDSKIVGIPLAELRPFLPHDFLFGLIQNRGRMMIAHGKRTLCPGDNVILITSPKHTKEILRLF